MRRKSISYSRFLNYAIFFSLLLLLFSILGFWYYKKHMALSASKHQQLIQVMKSMAQGINKYRFHNGKYPSSLDMLYGARQGKKPFISDYEFFLPFAPDYMWEYKDKNGNFYIWLNPRDPQKGDLFYFTDQSQFIQTGQVALSPREEEGLNSQLDRLNKLLEEKKFSAAETLTRDILAVIPYPDEKESLYGQLAMILVKLERPEESVKVLQSALLEFPRSHQLRDFLEQVTPKEEGPPNPLMLGWEHLKRPGGEQEALAQFQQALQEDPHNGDVYLGLGMAYSRLSDSDNALKNLEIAKGIFKGQRNFKKLGEAEIAIHNLRKKLLHSTK